MGRLSLGKAWASCSAGTAADPTSADLRLRGEAMPVLMRTASRGAVPSKLWLVNHPAPGVERGKQDHFHDSQRVKNHSYPFVVCHMSEEWKSRISLQPNYLSFVNSARPAGRKLRILPAI